MSHSLAALETRFLSVWRRQALSFDEKSALTVFNRLIEKYNEPWRVYHSLGHISASLEYFDACRSHAEDADAIDMAIWFHDCIYQVGASDNEQKSKEWFLEQTEGQFAPEWRDKIAELIMDTTHRETPATKDGKLLADVDMTSFGRPWDDYILDGKAVRAETKEQDSAQGDLNLAKFLRHLAGRDSLYYSPFYLTHYEQKAQENIARHLELLPAV